MPRQQSRSGFYFCISELKDSKNELILIFSGTLLQILGAIYEIVSVPYLTGFLGISGISFFMIFSKLIKNCC